MMDRHYDVAIIGGGVVGCALTFELTRCGYTCILIEKSRHLLTGASSGNSGMVHTGFDVKEPIETECIKRSQSKIFPILDKLNVPVNMIGATMVAWTETQFQRIHGVLEHANNFGIDNVRQLSKSELHQKEPYLNNTAAGGVFIPGEAVIDPWLFPALLADDAKQKGAQLLTDCQLESCNWTGQEWVLHTSRGIVHARCAVNAAGLYGDIVGKLVGKNQFRIQPRKGQYSMYDKTARCLINSSIVPVPTDVGKGVIVFRSAYDNVVVGPTAEQVESRLPAPIDDVISRRLNSVAKETIPSLSDYNIVQKYTGVRPATQYKDYIIEADSDSNWITAGGIRSTGLSGCLGIAELVRDLVKDDVRIEPSRGQSLTLLKPDVCFTNYGTCMINNTEYTVTHPITLVGNRHLESKL